MSFSKSYSGKIADVKAQVSAETDPSAPYYAETDPAKADHGALFERTKQSLLAEIANEETSANSSGYVSCSISGHGSDGAHNYSVYVSRISGQ
jgi:hypothetical protein